MKTFFMTLMLLTSTVVVAGPEDRLDDTCYTATSKTPGFVPVTFCFETATLNTEANTLIIDGYGSNVPALFKDTTITRKNEDFYRFTSKVVIHKTLDTTCSASEFAELVITGLSDNYGFVEPTELKLTVNYEQTNDSCHSHTQNETVEYVLGK